jgi:cytochrome c-type biogenesis protein CcmE
VNSTFLLPAGEELEARRAHHSFRDPLGDFVSHLRIFEAFVLTKDRERLCDRFYLRRPLRELRYAHPAALESGDAAFPGVLHETGPELETPKNDSRRELHPKWSFATFPSDGILRNGFGSHFPFWNKGREMSPKLKLILGGCVFVAALAWLGFVGFQESKAYYLTVEEYSSMKTDLNGKTLKLAGDVLDGSIDRGKPQMEFVIGNKGKSIRVRYIGKAVIPDTFQAGSKALVEGTVAPDGVFQARHIEAKCASKYEAEFEKRNTS